jgi:hypothetical protein
MFPLFAIIRRDIR